MSVDLQHAEGALVGVLVGDSLGGRFEGSQPGMIRNRWPSDAALLAAVPGRYSAVAEMTASLAASLASYPEFDGGDFAARLVEGAETRRGYGDGTLRVLERLRDGEAWDEAANALPGRGCAGNAAAARAVPAGLAGDDPDWLRWLAEEQAGITHAHALAAEGAVLIATATALLLHAAGRPLEPERLLARLAEECRVRELRTHLGLVAEMLDAPFDAERVSARLGNNMTTLGSVPTALYCFASAPESFTDAMLRALRLGGNATSIAAMTGGLAGAYHGRGEIPENWQDRLEKGAVTAAALAANAEAIVDGAAHRV